MTSPVAGPSKDAPSASPVNVPNPLASHLQHNEDLPTSSTPLEMSNLGPKAVDEHNQATEPSETLEKDDQQFHTPAQSPTSENLESTNNPDQAPMQHEIDSAPPLQREQTAPAIGPSSNKPTPLPREAESEKALMITLLLTSGARHPYKIDERYLRKRNISVEGDNPINLSIYDLKNLIWREWRDGMCRASVDEPCRSRD